MAEPSGPSETRWLNADEQRSWRAYIDANRLINAALDRQLQRDSGMPHTYFEILVRLSEPDGRAMRMSQLADESGSSRSRLSHAVARLEERGWVRREACPTDGRGALAVLTDDGMAALADAAPGHVEQVRRTVLDRLSAEQVKHLGEICRAVLVEQEP
jgi:DNA-binding MarR family transcriptional regulator